MSLLTSANHRGYDCRATEKNVAGIGSPEWGGEEPLCSRKRLLSFGASSFGRPDRRSRNGSPVLHRYFRLLSRSPSQSEVGKAVQNRNWSNTMSQAQALPVDRETASSLNPLIGTLFTEDTLRQVSSIVSDMGYLLSVVANPPDRTDPEFRSLYLFCNVIASAIDYELSNPRLAGASTTPQGK